MFPTKTRNPILDTRILARAPPPPSVTLRLPPLGSETGWTGELWSKIYLLKYQDEDATLKKIKNLGH